MARPSPAVNETAHVADSQRFLRTRCSNKRSRTIAKGDGLRHRVSTPENTVRNSVDIDSSHSRAIVREIGERLRASFKEDREIPAQFRAQIERLRQSEREAVEAPDPN
jgi:hypothetical protein